MPRGGKREPGPGKRQGRPPKPPLEPVTDKNAASRLVNSLNSVPTKLDDPEVAGWRGLWDSMNAGIRLDARKYLYDKRDGKAVHTVNHLHDKPIEMNVNVTLSEAIQKARKRAGLAR